MALNLLRNTTPRAVGAPQVAADAPDDAQAPDSSDLGLGAGVGLQVGRKQLRAGMEVDWITKGEMADVLGDAFGKLRTREIPTIQELYGNALADAAGAVTIDLGSPSASKTWDVRRIAVVGPVGNEALVASTVRVYRVEVNGGRVVDGNLTLPAATSGVPWGNTYSRGQFNLKPQEHLLVRVTGYTVGVQVNVSVSAEETTTETRAEYSLG